MRSYIFGHLGLLYIDFVSNNYVAELKKKGEVRREGGDARLSL